jgi:hypothetical protein
MSAMVSGKTKTVLCTLGQEKLAADTSDVVRHIMCIRIRI